MCCEEVDRLLTIIEAYDEIFTTRAEGSGVWLEVDERAVNYLETVREFKHEVSDCVINQIVTDMQTAFRPYRQAVLDQWKKNRAEST